MRKDFRYLKLGVILLDNRSTDRGLLFLETTAFLLRYKVHLRIPSRGLSAKPFGIRIQFNNQASLEPPLIISS